MLDSLLSELERRFSDKTFIDMRAIPKAQAGSLWRRLSWAERHHLQLVLAAFHFSPSLPRLFPLISFYFSPTGISLISPIPLCPSSDVAFVQGSIVLAEGQPCWLDAPCSTLRKRGVVQGMATSMPLGQLAVGQALHDT